MIQKKRDRLELFIQEQTLGPGISGYRFVDLSNSALLEKNLRQERPINYHEELIDIMPAGVYSTGILFPLDASKVEDSTLANRHDNESTEAGDENSRDNEGPTVEEDAIPIDQMYPHSMGLTCCLASDLSALRTIDILVRARYYINVEHTPSHTAVYGVLCECDPIRFSEFITKLQLHALISMQNLHGNVILTMAKTKSDEQKAIKMSLRQEENSEAEKVKATLSEFDFVRKSTYASSLKQACYYELRNNCTDKNLQQKLYNAIQRLEETESFIVHIRDLLTTCGDGYGLWKATSVEQRISLASLDFTDFSRKKIYSYRDHPSLRDVFTHSLGKNAAGEEVAARLSVNIQISKDSRKKDNKIFLKVQLVNTSTPFVQDPKDSRYYSTFNALVNQRSFFGAKLSIAHPQLVVYNDLDMTRTQEHYDEDDVTQFIYRAFEDYAIGHGCSVKWAKENGQIKIETEYLPVCDTPDIEPIPRNKSQIVHGPGGTCEPAPYFSDAQALEFKWLSTFSTATNEQVVEALRAFVQCYQDWIDGKRARYHDLTALERSLAAQELDKCQADKTRILRNIDQFLAGATNSSNLQSFRMMNAAMFMQLWHAVHVKKNTVVNYFADPRFTGFNETFYTHATDKLFDTPHATWRPFQLAFILLNLDGIFRAEDDTHWEMRNDFVDLVWFPTGGGKTEAYLGIIALTIINRRVLFKHLGGGTAALMRYTLRLLTLQQFQRATLMIMALELMRRWDPSLLGQEPIFIGLWVGDNSLPNNMKPSSTDDKNNLLFEFKKLGNGQKSRVPYEYCPWCRSTLFPATQPEADKTEIYHYNRLHLKCSCPKCSFYYRPSRPVNGQGPIPVSLCDDEIYQHPPALLFGTVDKFAQLAHKVSDEGDKRNKDSRRIFGKGNWETGKPANGYQPPDLIIQDELHLLLGPLGSSVALFESAVDQLCTRPDGTRPKVISSTATTRNTDLQIMALFDRKVHLFPKPGVEADDSFFAFYKRSHKSTTDESPTYLSKRRYMGLLPTGRTQIWMQMRLAAILLTHRALFEAQHLESHTPLDADAYHQSFTKAMDYYHTVVSYFNSVKEVGKTESQIHTYLIKEIRRVFNRVVRPSKMFHALYTYNLRPGELTGRLSGEDVKNELDKVQSRWSATSRFARQIEDHAASGSVPPDFVVATNMISVGIDIARFNTILMNSMPRNIAEYIQASSRVARDSQGLVLTIHHPFRARDVSHYEKFIEFHEKMYSYVEPISITPFTQKAVDRYLGLYLAAMIRHTTRFQDRNSANTLQDHEVLIITNTLVEYFEKRCDRLQNSTADRLIKNLLQETNVENIRGWISAALHEWRERIQEVANENKVLVFKNKKTGMPQEQLYVDIEEYEGNVHSKKWQVPMSLRVIQPEAALKIKLR